MLNYIKWTSREFLFVVKMLNKYFFCLLQRNLNNAKKKFDCLTRRYFPPTMNSDLEAEGALAILNCPRNILNKNQEKRSKINSFKLKKHSVCGKLICWLVKKVNGDSSCQGRQLKTKINVTFPQLFVCTLLRWFSWCFFHLRIDLKTMIWFN